MKLTDEIRRKMFQYVEKFEDAVPIMQMQGLSNDEITKLIDKALETGKKIETNFGDEDYS